jgi:O-antigen ligase
MNQALQWIGENRHESPEIKISKRFAFVKFLRRYPIFLLAFGPPLFRSQGIDATKGEIDIWSFLQVGLLGAVAARSIYRLASAETILIPKQIRSIFRLAFLLGLLFTASTIYSPSRSVSAAYSVLYFLTLICMVEFVADVYKHPPNWIQCLFCLRFIAFLLVALDLLTFSFAPAIVLQGMRFQGVIGAPMTVICPMIAIISAYGVLHGLESKGRSVFYLLVGMAGEFSTQTRGSELALLLCLAILGAGWAKTRKRSAYLCISGFMASLLFSALILGMIGGNRLWNIFNRGQSAEGIATASGRTELWKFVIQYCSAHPQGMGYVAGYRILERMHFSHGSLSNLVGLGNAHNTYVQVLSDAGWLALAVYLMILIRVIYLGWRFARAPALKTVASSSPPSHAIRCALVLLVFFLANGMASADYVVPLKTMFYWQNLIIAIILGVLARLLVSARAQQLNFFR